MYRIHARSGTTSRPGHRIADRAIDPMARVRRTALVWLIAGATAAPFATATAAAPALPMATPAAGNAGASAKVSEKASAKPGIVTSAVTATAIPVQTHTPRVAKARAKPASARHVTSSRRSQQASKAAPSRSVAALPLSGLPLGAAAPVADSWHIALNDRTLNGALSRWAALAGWQLLWEMPVDYAVQANTTIPGKFEEAVALVVISMESAEIPMKAAFYEGNKVLRITAKGAQ